MHKLAHLQVLYSIPVRDKEKWVVHYRYLRWRVWLLIIVAVTTNMRAGSALP